MIFKFLKMAIQAAREKGKPCPRCGRTNTDCEGGIWYCHDCEKEF